MSEPKFIPGMLIKLKPENFPQDAYEGHGLILEATETHYQVLMYDLVKISRRNLSTTVIGQKRIFFSIEEADGLQFFEEV